MQILKDYDYRKIPIKDDVISIRDNLLVTAGARAAYMDMKNDIDLPSGLEGEDRLTEFIVDALDAYGKITDDIPFDEFIERELIREFGKRGEQL